MAKQNSLPSVDGSQEKPSQAMQPSVQSKEQKQSETIVVAGYMARRIDVKLPMKHREILHKKLRQLQDSGARLADGTEVSDKTKAVLWILENEVKA